MNGRAKTLADLLFTFMKIGAFTFGGGYAMIPIIVDSCVKKKHWITDEEMMNLTVIAESTPGPVSINAATFIGYKQAGLLGALFATFGMIVPSFIIISVIATYLPAFLSIQVIARAFSGIKIAVGILILDAAITMIKNMPETTLSFAIALCSCCAMIAVDIFSLSVSSVQLIVLAALISLLQALLQTLFHKERTQRKEARK